MKKIFLFICCVLLIGCQNEVPELPSHPIKTVREVTHQLVMSQEEVTIGDEESVFYKTYTKEGLESIVYIEMPDGSRHIQKENFYNKEHQKIKHYTYQGEDIIFESRLEYKDNVVVLMESYKDGELMYYSRKSLGDGKDYVTRSYDEDNNVIDVNAVTYQTDDTYTVLYQSYEYDTTMRLECKEDALGNQIEQKVFENDLLSSTWIFEYDTRNNILTQQNFNTDGALKVNTIYEYEYDQYDNIIAKSVIMDDSLIRYTTYEIDYWN